MISITGHLAIRTISGRNGDFNVGRLITSIGEFVIKDALLDQYTEGKYQGDFVITEIKPSYYTYGGRLVVEVRARLDSMTLEGVDELTQEESELLEQKEQDPVEEEASIAPPAKLEAKPKIDLPQDAPFGMDPPPAQPTVETHDEKDAELFGTVWPLGERVRLDPTVGRHVIRQQTQRLDELGYTFDFKTQFWIKPIAEQ